MKIQLLLLAALISSNAYSITVKTNNFFNATESKSIALPAPKSLVKSGRLNIFDLNGKFIMVNNEVFKLSKNLKIYDDAPKPKSFVRFLLSPENEVIEMWVKNEKK